MSAAGKKYQRAGEGERGIGVPGKWYALSRFGRSAERRGPFPSEAAAKKRWHGTGWVYARGEEERGDIVRRHTAAWDANRRANGNPHEVARIRIEQEQRARNSHHSQQIHKRGLFDEIQDFLGSIFS